MLGPFICGSFHREEDDETLSSPSSTPRKTRKNNLMTCTSFDFLHNHLKDNNNKKNPYSSRGLDKFSALLSDLEDKRQKIYSQLGSDDMYFIRFAYSNTDDFKPIVVKLKDKQEDKKHTTTKNKDKHDTQSNSEALDNKPIEAPEIVQKVKQVERGSSKTNKKKFSWHKNLDWLRRPYYYLPAIVIMIMLLIAAFGRSFAILCTSIAWYTIPTLQESSRVRMSMKKKDYARRLSEKSMVTDGLTSPKKSSGPIGAASMKEKSP